MLDGFSAGADGAATCAISEEEATQRKISVAGKIAGKIQPSFRVVADMNAALIGACKMSHRWYSWVRGMIVCNPDLFSCQDICLDFI